jgi:hypothetical protein
MGLLILASKTVKPTPSKLVLSDSLLRGTVDVVQVCGRLQQTELHLRTDSRRRQRSCEEAGANVVVL